MRVWTSSAIAACCALGIALAAPAQAQLTPAPKAPGAGGVPGGPGAPGGGGSPKFILSVCNKSGVKNVWMAFASLKDPKTWHVHGWYKVTDAGCSSMGEFYRDTIYYFAGDGELKTTWSGESTEQCVNPSNQFDYVAAGAVRGQPHQCKPEEALVGFDTLTVKPSSPKFELTLQ
jgi:Protein of unknown function (DUF1036)